MRQSSKVRTYNIMNIQHHTYLERAWNYELTTLWTYSTIHILGELQSTNLRDYKHTALFILRQSLKVLTYKITNIQHHTYFGRAWNYELTTLWTYSTIHILGELQSTNLRDYKHTALFILRQSLKVLTYKITNIQHHTYFGRAWNYELTRLLTYSTIHIWGELESKNLPDYKYTALFILKLSLKVGTYQITNIQHC